MLWKTKSCNWQNTLASKPWTPVLVAGWHPHWSGHGGKDLVVDYSIAYACAPCFLHSTIRSRPRKRHAPAGRTQEYQVQGTIQKTGCWFHFKPLVMEMMHGAISDTFLKFIKKLASAAADTHDRPYCMHCFLLLATQNLHSAPKVQCADLMAYLAQCKIDGTATSLWRFGFC